MTKEFCDICEVELTALDKQPLIREIEIIKKPEIAYARAVAFVAITNEHNHPISDICTKCKIKIVNEGQVPQRKPEKKIATLQPRVAADIPAVLEPFAEPPALFPQKPVEK